METLFQSNKNYPNIQWAPKLLAPLTGNAQTILNININIQEGTVIIRMADNDVPQSINKRY